jgi:hypothetical protein
MTTCTCGGLSRKLTHKKGIFLRTQWQMAIANLVFNGNFLSNMKNDPQKMRRYCKNGDELSGDNLRVNCK